MSKKKLVLASCFFFFLAGAQAQPSVRAGTILRKVHTNMSAAKTVSYSQHRSFYYRDDHYKSKDSLQIVFEYASGESAAVPRYQAKDLVADKIYIYNGAQCFTLDNRAGSLDVDPNTRKDLGKAFFFRQSWANLYSMLPAIIQNDSVFKSVRDTVIAGKPCYRVDLHAPRKRFAAFNGFTPVPVDTIQWKYELVVDKRSMLPRQFNVRIIKPANQADYIRATFDEIRINGRAPEERSWYFSTYTDRYPNHTAKRNEQVKAGTAMPDWKLPVYRQNAATDTVHSESLKGKVTLLTFWIKSCGYCMTALPHLNSIQERFRKEPFQFIAVNCYDTREDVAFFHQKYTPAYTMCYDGLRLAERLGIYGYPMALLIDRAGTIVNVSAFDKESLVKKISEALSSTSGQ